MDEFNRVLKRDDMDGLVFVDFVQHGGKRSGLAAAGCARHQNQSVLFRAILWKIGDSPSDAIVGMSDCDLRMTMPKFPLCLKMFTRNRVRSFTA